MAYSRREFLVRAGAAAFFAGGHYGLVDRMAGPTVRPSRAAGNASVAADTLPPEQHLFRGLSTVKDDGTLVTVPPRHHAVVTATLTVPATTAALQNAQAVLESAVAGLEARGLLDFRPAGLGLAIGWGLPYFNRLPAAVTASWLPVDLVASQANNQTTLALVDAMAFASDPTGLVLEQNDLAFVLASDHLDHIATASDALFNGPPADLMTVTSIRRGFVDGHQVGSEGQSLTKRMAVAAGIPGAGSIPDSAELFLGFTSTQRAALGQSVIANLETLPGVTDQWPDGYFVNGTTMHLSHIFEDLAAWYGSSYRQRAGFAFSPTIGTKATRGRTTLPAGPSTVESLAQVQSDFATYGFTGHSTSMQPVSRLPASVTDNYGNPWPTGSAIPERADFNTLDNPFAYSSDPGTDHMSSDPAAGLHFVVFMPTSTSFNVMRQAMDGQYGSGVALGPGAVHSPFNNVLQTTHRQNFLISPPGPPLVSPGRDALLTLGATVGISVPLSAASAETTAKEASRRLDAAAARAIAPPGPQTYSPPRWHRRPGRDLSRCHRESNGNGGLHDETPRFSPASRQCHHFDGHSRCGRGPGGGPGPHCSVDPVVGRHRHGERPHRTAQQAGDRHRQLRRGTGAGATGTVTYAVYADSACTVEVGAPDTENVTAGVPAASAPVSLAGPGTYYWLATYSGDANNDPSTSPCQSETEIVSASGTSTTTTTVPASGRIELGGTNADTATVQGDATDGSPTGAVSFSLCGPLPGAEPATPCTGGTDLLSSPVPLTPGPGDTATATSPSFSPLSPGWWCFANAYSGDANYDSSADDSPGECFDVLALKNGSPDYAGFALLSKAPKRAADDFGPTTSSAGTTFTVPSETCTSQDSGIIIGTGIFSSVSGWVSAGGIEVACQGGSPLYDAQIEINNIPQTVSPPFTPAAGDTVTTLVSIIPGQTTVSVDDVTQNVDASAMVAAGSVGTYVSVGTDGDQQPDVLPVPNVGALNFSNSTIDGKSLKASGAIAISRVQNGQLVILTAPLDPSGKGFGQASKSAATFTPDTASAPTSGSIVAGDSDSDTATVTGNASSGAPTGTVSFYACGPTSSPQPCTSMANPVGGAQTVTADGDAATAASPSFTPTGPGYWCFAADYSGDSNYAVSSDTTVGECVHVSAAPLQITTSSLPPATIGEPYAATIEATGGTPHYKWKKISGSLPAGFSLKKKTGKMQHVLGAGHRQHQHLHREGHRQEPSQADGHGDLHDHGDVADRQAADRQAATGRRPTGQRPRAGGRQGRRSTGQRREPGRPRWGDGAH